MERRSPDAPGPPSSALIRRRSVRVVDCRQPTQLSGSRDHPARDERRRFDVPPNVVRGAETNDVD